MPQLQPPSPIAATTSRDRAVVALAKAAVSLSDAIAAAHRQERVLAAADPVTEEEDVARRLHRLDLLAETAAVIGGVVQEHAEDTAEEG